MIGRKLLFVLLLVGCNKSCNQQGSKSNSDYTNMPSSSNTEEEENQSPTAPDTESEDDSSSSVDVEE